MRLRAGACPIRTGAGLAGGATLRALWTPSLYAGRLFSATAPLVVDTSNGAHVTSLADDHGGAVVLAQATSTKQLIISTTSPVDARAAWVVSHAAVTDQSVATGGATGTADHTLTWVGKLTAFGAGYFAALRMGTSAASSQWGTVGAGTLWGGRGGGTGGGNGAPNVPWGDSSLHVFTKIVRSGVVYLYIDGALVLAGLADAGYANGAGFGIGAGLNGSADALMQHVLFASTAASLGPTGDKALHEAWIARTFPSYALFRLLLCIGDSQTYGYSATVAPANWPTRITALGLLPHAYDVYYDGTGTPWPHTAVGGWTTTDILANYQLGAVTRYTGLRPRIVATVWAGTNDLFFGSSTAAQVITNLTTITTALRAAGIFVVMITPLARTQVGTPGTYEADRQIIRAAILAGTTGADVTCDVGGHAALQTPSNATYFQADEVHLNPAAQDAIVAPMIATAIGSA